MNADKPSSWGNVLWPIVLAAGGTITGSLPIIKDYADNGKIDHSIQMKTIPEKRIEDERRSLLEHMGETFQHIVR